MWYIKNIKAENLFSWKTLNLVLNDKVVYSITGSNGSGKSSIFEIIKWVLFKKSSKKTICRYKAKNGTGEITLSNGKRDVRIGRETSSPATVYINGTEDTQEQVESILGCSYLGFMSSVMCDQKRVSSFVQEKSPAGKSKIFGEMIGASVLDQVREKVQKLKNEHEQEYTTAEAVLREIEADIETMELEFDGKSPKEYLAYAKSLKKKVDDMENTIHKLQEEFNIAVQRSKDWQSYRERKIAIDSIKSNINALSLDFKTLKGKIDSRKIKEIFIVSKEDLDNMVEKLNLEISSLEKSGAVVKSKIKGIEDALENGGACPTCGTELSDQATLDSLTGKLVFRKTQLKKIQNAISKRKLGKELQFRTMAKIAAHEIDQKEIAEKMANKKQSILDAKNTLKYLDLKEPDFPDEDSNIVRDKLNRMVAIQGQYRDKANAVKNNILNYSKAKEKKKLKQEQFNKVYNKYNLFKWLFDNIPVMKLRFIDQSSSTVESIINENLSKIGIPFMVSIETQKELSKGKRIKDEFQFKIVNIDSDKVAHKEDISGGEEVCILLATQFAINTVSNSNIGFEVFDEIYGMIDTKNKQVIIDSIKQRGQQRQILSVSHDPEISNSYDSEIVIFKREGISRIKGVPLI